MIEATAKADTVEEQARVGLRAAWRVMTEDRRKARVIVLEVVGVSERLERLRRENRHAFADILVRNAMSIAGDDITLRMDPVLTARALIGAGMELLVDWIHGDVNASPEEIVEHLTEDVHRGGAGVGRRAQRSRLSATLTHHARAADSAARRRLADRGLRGRRSQRLAPARRRRARRGRTVLHRHLDAAPRQAHRGAARGRRLRPRSLPRTCWRSPSERGRRC